MKKHHSSEIPIRSKLEMAKDIAEIVHCYQLGQKAAADLLLEDLKSRSVYFDSKIQQDVLMFAEQIQFQRAYDQWRTVTEDIQTAADRLIRDLGLRL